MKNPRVIGLVWLIASLAIVASAAAGIELLPHTPNPCALPDAPQFCDYRVPAWQLGLFLILGLAAVSAGLALIQVVFKKTLRMGKND